MGLLRSETMKSGMVVLPTAQAYKYVARLGTEAKIQFEDMNTHDMRRAYRKYIQRIEEMERMLRFNYQELDTMGKQGLAIEKYKTEAFLKHQSDKFGAYTIDGVEAELKKIYITFVKMKELNSQVMNDIELAKEELEVVKRAKVLFGEMPDGPEESTGNRFVEDDQRIGFLSGVIATPEASKLSRALFRATRGNSFVDSEPIDTDVAGGKSTFVASFQGGKGSAMYGRVTKVCQAFQVRLYAMPRDLGEASRRENALEIIIGDKTQTQERYRHLFVEEARYLTQVTEATGMSLIEDWRLFCIREKSIYHTLNLFKGDQNLMANVWFPESDEENIKNVLKSMDGEVGGSLVPDSKEVSKGTPPTYFQQNEFTSFVAGLVETYGIPCYKEAHAALLSQVTFPFIFGMMYGDIGHGTLLFLIGLGLCATAETNRKNNPVLVDVRYWITMMGFFAVYCGFIYNDFFSLGVPLFDTRFYKDAGGNFKPDYDATNTGDMSTCDVGGHGPCKHSGPYPFGLDWAWAGAENELLFQNSLKMKLSVLFGVLQMTVGVFLKFSNAIYFGSAVDLIFECIPNLVFMVCFFGFMDFMILYKWVHSMPAPPSIINSLICMAMGQDDKFPLWPGSTDLAKVFMVCCMLSIPIMLFPKPFILLAQHKVQQKKKTQQGIEAPLLAAEELEGDAEHGAGAKQGGGGHGHGAEFEFGEVFIHQVIETIEYVLGTISHTASYLRIWALSLAHQQLSLVFYQKTLSNALVLKAPLNGLAIYLAFAIWFGITLGVLMGMDVLECILHTLRLHWVEFQSKFYNLGGVAGIAFAPYNVRSLLDNRE